MEPSLKNKTLALFFTYGVSLVTWKNAGTLERDTALYTRLLQNELKITFVTYGGKEDVILGKRKGFSVIANIYGLPIFLYFLFLPYIIYRCSPRLHVIKSHQFIGTLPALITARIFRIPYIARGGYLPTVFFKKYRRKFLSLGWWKRCAAEIDEWMVSRCAKVIVVPSVEETQYLQARHPHMKTRVEIIPNWIDIDRFRPMPKVPKKPRSVLFVGRFESQKNPLLFLEALMRIQDVSATMIGSGSMYDEMCAFIQEHGLHCTVMKDRIPNEQLPVLYNEHEVYVLPSCFEGGSPKTLLEAMACGLPVVASDTFGVRSAFVHETHGLQCPLDARSIAQAIETLLADKALCSEYGQNGRTHIENTYALSSLVEKEQDLLENLFQS